MSTTLDQFQAGGGIRYALVAAIEGYDVLLTSHHDTAAVETAWSGTPWTIASACLRVDGEQEQSIEPWQRSFAPSHFDLYIRDTGTSSALANLVFATAAGNETVLKTAISANATTIAVADTSAFASSGAIYIGTERITYTGKTATTFTGCTRGTLHPFGTSTTANQVGREHILADVAYDVSVAPKVTDAPRIWTGKYVGIWVHRIVGEVLDTQAEAHLAFAGILKEIADDPSGEVVLRCEDITSKLKTTTLLRDQFSARIREGIWLQTATKFRIEVEDGASSYSSELVGVPSGASGAYEFNAGKYNETLIATNLITNWLINAANDGKIPGTVADWSYGAKPDGSGTILDFFQVLNQNTAVEIKLFLPIDVAHFLGWDDNRIEMYQGVRYRVLHGYTNSAGAAIWFATYPANRYMLRPGNNGEFEIHVDGVVGTWMDQKNDIPYDLLGLQFFVNQTGGTPKEWGLVKFGHFVALAGREIADSTEFHIYQTQEITQQFGGDSWSGADDLLEQASAEVRLEQIFIYEGSFKDFALRALASTGASLGATGYNHATYDAFPAQMGAGIPWTLLGDQFLDSITALDQDLGGKLLYVIDKPTPLETEIVGELLLSTAWIVWVSGQLRIARFQSPVGQRAIWNFSEANKGSSVQGDAQRIVAVDTDKYLRNVLRFSYNRKTIGNADEYNNVATVKYAPSIADYGESRMVEIKARHTYAKIGGGSIRMSIANIVSTLLPVFGRPVKVLRNRTIQPEFYEGVAPGDLATVSDNFVRDPTTGARGISAKPAIILAHRTGWMSDGEMYGEVDLLISNLDNTTVYSPAMLMTDQGANGGGYDSAAETGGNAVLYVETHAYSDSTEDDDALSFEVNDIIDINQIDPSGGAGEQWTGIKILSITDHGTYYTIGIDQDLAGFTGLTRLRVTSTNYAAAVAAQQLDAYQADDADYRVENARSPYEYATGTTSVVTAHPSTELPERYNAAQYGDGVPYSVSSLAAAGRAVNNLIDYKLATQCPMILSSEAAVTSAAYTWIFTVPYFMGPGTSLARTFAVAAGARDAAGYGGYVRVTFSSVPPAGDATTGIAFSSPYDQVTFTIAGASYAIATAQNVSQIPASIYSGYGYLTVEAYASSGVGSGDIRIRAIGMLQQNART